MGVGEEASTKSRVDEQNVVNFIFSCGNDSIWEKMRNCTGRTPKAMCRRLLMAPILAVLAIWAVNQHTITTSQPRRQSSGLMGDICIVGGGLSAAVLAERHARVFNHTVLVLEKRDHIGGNCYDYIDHETGIRVNKYGAHLFHTRYKHVWDYLQ